MNNRLRLARLVAHHAAQLAVAPASTFAPEPDSAHTALSWSSTLRAFVGARQRGRQTGLRLADLTLVVAGPDSQLATLPLTGMTRLDALSWLGRQFDEVLTLPEHELPPHEVQTGGRFPAPDEATRQLASWLEGAADVLEPQRARREGASAVRLWSHHFDVATLVSLGHGRSVGLGLSPGDGSYDEPYWYVTPWPYPTHQRRGVLRHGRWHSQGWVGAVLTQAEPAPARTQVEAFLDEAFEACRELTEEGT